MTFFLGPLGPTELLLILLVILIIFGAGRLPEIGEGLGKGIKSFKKAVKDEHKQVSQEEDEKKKELPHGEDKEE